MSEQTVFNCQYCGKECASQLGLSSHERHCKENPSNAVTPVVQDGTQETPLESTGGVTGGTQAMINPYADAVKPLRPGLEEGDRFIDGGHTFVIEGFDSAGRYISRRED